ncbi:MAG: DMT family transporter [Pseudomonadota bacterium]
MLDPAYAAALLALCSAFLFALANQFQNLGLDDVDVRSGAIVAFFAAASVYWLLTPLFLESWYWFTSAALVFALVGLFRPVVSGTLSITGIKMLGPTMSSAIASSAPLFAALFAIALLGEVLTWPTALGTGAVIIGCVLAATRRTALGKGSQMSWPWWAVLLPVGAAIIRAGAQAGTKYGYDVVPSPLFAALVGSTVSAVLALSVFKIEGRRFTGALTGYRWFAIAGVISATSIYTLNKALQLGSVLLVSPIVALSPVFAMLLGLIIFKREVITWRTVATLSLVLAGVLLVIFDRAGG